MAAIHNYYRILGIKTTAGIQEINQAIAALRQKDAAGNYSATINTIAATLSEPQKRAAYDDELGLDAALRGDYYVAIQAKEEPKKQTFVDVSGKEYGSEHPLSIHGALNALPAHAGTRAAHRLLLRQTVLR